MLRDCPICNVELHSGLKAAGMWRDFPFSMFGMLYASLHFERIALFSLFRYIWVSKRRTYFEGIVPFPMLGNSYAFLGLFNFLRWSQRGVVYAFCGFVPFPMLGYIRISKTCICILQNCPISNVGKVVRLLRGLSHFQY